MTLMFGIYIFKMATKSPKKSSRRISSLLMTLLEKNILNSSGYHA